MRRGPLPRAGAEVSMGKLHPEVDGELADERCAVRPRPAERSRGAAHDRAAGRVKGGNLQQPVPPPARYPQPRPQYHPGRGDRSSARGDEDPALLLQFPAIGGQDVRQLLIEDLAGRLILVHGSSMSAPGVKAAGRYSAGLLKADLRERTVPDPLAQDCPWPVA